MREAINSKWSCHFFGRCFEPKSFEANKFFRIASQNKKLGENVFFTTWRGHRQKTCDVEKELKKLSEKRGT